MSEPQNDAPKAEQPELNLGDSGKKSKPKPSEKAEPPQETASSAAEKKPEKHSEGESAEKVNKEKKPKAEKSEKPDESGKPATEEKSEPKSEESPPKEGRSDEPKKEKPDSGENSERDGNEKPSGDNRNRDNQQRNDRKDGGGDRRKRRRRRGGRGKNRDRDGEEDIVDGKTRKERYLERKEKERQREAELLEAAPALEVEGLVEISAKGFGFIREPGRNFDQSPKDVFITPEIVRVHGLRDGLMIKCISKEGSRGPQLIELVSINGKEPEEYHNLPYFEELTAINPNKKLALETTQHQMTTRVVDLMAPIGRGQRGLIVAPPRTGKTTFLHHMAEGILENYEEEMHLMVLLIDERPEEVTDFQRSFPGAEVFASSNDSDSKSHTRIAMLAIERAKRLVEAGEHVFLLMDSITRLARSFNTAMRGGKGRGVASGGLVVGALEIPRKLFAAARNTREAGSLTIIATALVQTNSKADEAIFQEFKGTGNMELVLDRQLAQNYVYPAVDINKSGTRREELLLAGHQLEKIHIIRRGLAGYRPVDAMEWLLKCMERYPSNAQMLLDIKTTAVA